MAIRDKKGNLISSPSSLKNLYLKTYLDRLSPAVVKNNYDEIFELKCKLWDSRNLNLKRIKSPEWSMSQLEDSLKRLKTNKARDPHGMTNELVKEGFIGYDLKYGILMLLNTIKNQMKIPKYMKWANITSIYKKKGSRTSMENQRGVFGLTLLKKVLDNIIFNEYYDKIDKNMSDSNIGGRKYRMAKDHLFILHGIINSVKNGNEEPIEIHVYVKEKVFDKLWLKDTMNDLVDTLPEEMKNDRLSLVYESNKITKIAVNTPSGITEREVVEEIVQQGGTWGPIQCSNSVDSVGKECKQSNKYCYKYKGIVKVPPSVIC